MRSFMWFAIGFALMCAIGVYFSLSLWLVLIVLLLLAATIFLWRILPENCKAVRVVLLGCLAAAFWVWLFDYAYLSSAREASGQELVTSIEILDYSENTDYGITAEGRIRLQGKPYRIRIYSYTLQPLLPGDTVTGTVRLQFTPGGENGLSYYSSEGVFLIGYMDDGAMVMSANKARLSYLAANTRQKLRQHMKNLFSDDVLGFVQALLIGDRSLLDYETKSNLSVSGIRHVVAVSGLHVSILFSLVYMLVGFRRFVTPIVGWSVLLVFAAVTGFTPSVVRACMMHGLMLCALMLDKEYDPPTALSFAVLTMLLLNPSAVTSVALQLSTACVAGILLFSGKISGFILSERCLGAAKGKTLLARLKRWLAGSVSVTLSTLVTTTPLCAVYFGMVSLVSVLTNLLTLSVVTLVFYGVLIACVAGAVYLPAGRLIAWLTSWLVRYVLSVSKILASFPLSAVYTRSIYVVAWLVFVYVILAFLIKGKGKNARAMVSAVIVGLVLSVFLSWNDDNGDKFRITVLDVGQGQCILLQENDSCYMVDCGGDYSEDVADNAAAILLSQGITKLDGLILTHFDQDHAGAAQMLLSRVPAKRLYLPEYIADCAIKQSLQQAYPDEIYWVTANEQLRLADSPITIFAGLPKKTDNESSLCVLFQPTECDILITGDRASAGEHELLSVTQLPELEVLVVGHHGAKDACGMKLLHETMPKTAVISVGANNPYGHPSDEVMERLTMFGCQILRTDLNGMIVIRG